MDTDFYLHLKNHYKKVAIPILVSIMIATLGPKLDCYLINNESFRYWTPFLNPNECSLNKIKNLPTDSYNSSISQNKLNSIGDY